MYNNSARNKSGLQEKKKSSGTFYDVMWIRSAKESFDKRH